MKTNSVRRTYLAKGNVRPFEGLAVLLLLIVGGISHAWAQAIPTITSVSPPDLIAGVRQQRLTITGSNFIPTTHVFISLPNSAPQAAPDVAVISTRYLNSTTLIVTVDVNRLSSGPRMVDVINSTVGDFTITSSGTFPTLDPQSSLTTQQIFITPADSLAGPVQVQNIILSYPRDGTIIQQGNDVYGEAVLTGAGSGLATGVWLWDGNVVEQFAANVIGGESTTIRTSSALPSVYTGPHTLQVQITTPQSMNSRPVQVVVNGGNWNVLRLLTPRFGAAYGGVTGPVLRWTPVPGAAKYQVGFSSTPLFDEIADWHETQDSTWIIPADIWKNLPDGEIFWTVRSVDMSGDVRRPVSMRSLWHISAGALEASRPSPRLSPRGSLLLEWNALKGKTFYLVTISSDPDGADVLRRYLTEVSEADLYALQASLSPNGTYYWQVQAFSPSHRNIMTGPRQNFQVPTARARAAPTGASLQLVSLRISDPAIGPVTRISRRSPTAGETVSTEQPHCEIAFENAVDANNVALSIDGVDVTSMAEISANNIKYSPVFPLDNGEHSVQLDVKPDSEDWKFKVVAKSEPQQIPSAAAARNDAEVVAKPEGQPRVPDEVGPEFKTHFGFDPQLGSSPTPNQVTMTGGEQTTFHRGGWKVDFNGSGMFQAAITPDPERVFGRVQDYVGQIDYSHAVWDVGARFGLLAPSMYTDAQFITTATPRQAVEPKIATPAGAFSYYANTNDVGSGGGDIASYHQLIRGAGYEAPVPAKWATFRLMWMNARDIGPVLGTNSAATSMQSVYLGVVPETTPGIPITVNPNAITPPLAAGDMYGGLMKLHLPSNLEFGGEYAISQTRPDVTRGSFTDPSFAVISTSPQVCSYDPTQVPPAATVPDSCVAARASQRIFGRAWRSSLDWHWKKTVLNVAYRDVTSDFSNPANPSITAMGNPNRRGLDSSFNQGTRIGDFDFGYHYLQSNVGLQGRPATVMNNLTWGWRKKLKTNTQIMLRGHDALISSGDIPLALKTVDRKDLIAQRLLSDQHDIGFNSSLVQSVGAVNASATVSRDWFRNSLIFGQNSIVTGTQFSVNTRRVSFFQLQSSWSANWAVRDKSTQGGTRILNLYVLPTVWMPQTPLSLSPLVSLTKTKGQLGSGIYTADLSSSQLGGRLSWRLPTKLRRALFSIEGARVEMRNNLLVGIPGINSVDKRLAMMLSFAQDQTEGRL